MSYILDALKQSDHQRRNSDSLKQPLPTLAESQAIQAPSRPHWLLFGILLMLLLGIGAYAYQKMVSSIGGAVAAVPPSVPVLVEQPENSSDSLPDSASLYGVQIAVSEPVTEVETRPRQAPEPSVNSTRTRQQSVDIPVAVTPAPPVPQEQQVALLKPVPVTRSVTPGSNESQAEATPPESEPEVIYWRQLPVQVQRSLPQLNFSVHIYSDKPASRMVKINGRMLREGDPVSADMRLDEITRAGVILLYKGYRFRMNPV